jgi:aryl-alcohol dehydrogenase-like predicted oxidoreductase
MVDVMLPTAPFGRSGHDSTRVIFGAAGLGGMDQDAADRVLAQVEAAGINHIDTAAGYGDSELLLQPWLADQRDEVFLATKTGDRDGDTARASLERSLERMGVDHVDLIQLHNLVEPHEWEVAHRPGGAVEALARARDEGLTRFIGVTGHGLRIARMHRLSLEQFPFDSVLLPVNYSLLAEPGYAADVDELLAICERDGVAAQTIKAIARRRWSDDAGGPRHSWYEPLSDPAAIERAVRFVVSDPRLFLITSSDYRQLPAIVEAASGSLDRPSAEELDADIETLGITPLFDGSTLERI